MASTRASTLTKEHARGEDGKLITDPIYGPMFFSAPVISFIDTAEFQRLRDIKQLGGTPYVYPGGVHTRFEHSLGVCHLTGYFLKILKERNPAIAHLLTEKVILCLEIAALCHDLGHGPLSRVFQDQFLQRLKDVQWSHNDASVRIFENIIQQQSIKDVLVKNGIGEQDIMFIKAAMRGEIPPKHRENRFLYEIVKNRRNGLDCNMFDSVLRDSYHTGVKSSFNHLQIMENTKICKVKDENRLCLRYKEQLTVRELFYTSWALQTLVYTHKTTRAVEMMFAEALEKADSRFKILDAITDSERLVKLSDSIFNEITRIEDTENLEDAKDLLRRIRQRKLYRFCGQTNLKRKGASFIGDSADDSGVDSPENSPDTQVQRQRPRQPYEKLEHHALAKKVVEGIIGYEKLKVEITADDIFVEIITIFYGNGKNDPLDDIDFVNKEGELVDRSPVTHSRGPLHFLRAFKDQYIRVYCCDADNKGKKKEIQNRFYKWCLQNQYEMPKDMEKTPIEHTEEIGPPSGQRSNVKRRLQYGDSNDSMETE